MANTIVFTPQPNNVVKVTQTNVVPVKVDQGVITPGSEPPFVLRQNTGVIGGISDMFALTPAEDGELLVFDQDIAKYVNTDRVKLAPRTTSIVSSALIEPNYNVEDKLFITALATDVTFDPPIGTFFDGSLLLFRIKDNGTSRAFTWNAIYRESTTLELPQNTTAGKTMNVGFMYNGPDNKWDLLAVIDGL